MVRGGVAPKLIDYIYPLGTVLAFASGTDPNQIYTHQTWERFAEGKTLVGVNEEETEFNTVGKTGGEKTHKLTVAEMPAHTHNLADLNNSSHVYSSSISVSSSASSNAPNWTVRLNKATSGYFKSTETSTYRLVANSRGGDAAHNNLQPYITVYYWKRTA